jgi:hypothetical protein
MESKPQPDTPQTSIADFAAALNPPAGALADALPFSLTPPSASKRPRARQIDLFTERQP